MIILLDYLLYCMCVFALAKPVLVDDCTWVTLVNMRGVWEAYRLHYHPNLTAYVMYRVSVNQPFTDQEADNISRLTRC